MKILLIDDHALFREGLSLVLCKLNEHVNILEASTLDHAMQQISDTPDLDLVLLDLYMPDNSGFEILEKFSETYPNLPVVILSSSTKRSDIQRVLDLGAKGFIPKNTASDVMLNALKLIFSGGIYAPPNISQQTAPSSPQVNKQTPQLTPRQLEVLDLVVKGNSNKVIAAQLNLSESTIKMHISAILNNLGVSNRTQAAMAAEKLGLFLQ